MTKQFLIDFLVILVIPAVLLGGYIFWKSSDEGLSFEASANDTTLVLGTKVKGAVSTLQSITLDGVIFSDPVFMTLKDFEVPVPESELGREYPFSTPELLREMLRRSSTGPSGTRSSGSGLTPVQRIDALSIQ